MNGLWEKKPRNHAISVFKPNFLSSYDSSVQGESVPFSPDFMLIFGRIFTTTIFLFFFHAKQIRFVCPFADIALRLLKATNAFLGSHVTLSKLPFFVNNSSKVRAGKEILRSPLSLMPLLCKKIRSFNFVAFIRPTIRHHHLMYSVYIEQIANARWKKGKLKWRWWMAKCLNYLSNVLNC